MASDTDTYIKELQAAMAGADPALVQDALFDAEEYLQAEVAAGADFAAAVEGYGSPQEVAAAYLGMTPGHEASRGVVLDEGGSSAAAVGRTDMEAEAFPEALEQASDEVAAAAGPSVIGDSGRHSRPVPGGVQAGMAAASAESGAFPGGLRQIFGVFADLRVYKALVYMVISLGTGIAYFTIVVTGVSTAGGMLVLIIGLPLLLLVLGIVRALALFEGRVVELLLEERMPRRLRAEPPGAGFVQRMWFWVKDGRTWASMAYMVLMLPLGTIYFTIAIGGLALGAGLVTSPFWAWIGEYSFVHEGVAYGWWFDWWVIPPAVAVGAIMLIALMHAIRWIGRGHAALAKALLVRLG